MTTEAITCKQCGQTNLIWVMVNKQPRLSWKPDHYIGNFSAKHKLGRYCNRAGILHDCRQHSKPKERPVLNAKDAKDRNKDVKHALKKRRKRSARRRRRRASDAAKAVNGVQDKHLSAGAIRAIQDTI